MENIWHILYVRFYRTADPITSPTFVSIERHIMHVNMHVRADENTPRVKISRERFTKVLSDAISCNFKHFTVKFNEFHRFSINSCINNLQTNFSNFKHLKSSTNVIKMQIVFRIFLTFFERLVF